LAALDNVVDAEPAWRRSMLAGLSEGAALVLALTARYDEALDAFRRAVDAVPSHQPVRFAGLHREIARCHEAHHDWVAAHAALHRAAETLEPLRDEPAAREEWLRLHLERMAIHYWRGEVEDLVRLRDEIRSLIDGMDLPPQLEATVIARLRMVEMRVTGYVLDQQAVTDSARGVQLARRFGTQAELADELFGHGFVCLWHGDLDGARASLEEALPVAERIQSLTLLARTHTYLTVIHRFRGQVAAAELSAQQSLAVARKAHIAEYEGFAHGNLAWAAMRRGDAAEARTHVGAGLAAWGAHDYSYSWALRWPLLALSLQEGHLQQAVEQARYLATRSLMPQTPDPVARELRRAADAADDAAAEEHLARASAEARVFGLL
jgi:tetratricopeptide (TPR) repeat protein